jgi:hypothetical protein
MSDEELRQARYGAFKNRALMYWHVFRELRDDLGEARAGEIMGRAIHRRGTEIGRQFARFAPRNLAGLAETDIATLCRIAGRVDDGTFESAGFAFSADTWQPGREGCCHLHK